MASILREKLSVSLYSCLRWLIGGLALLPIGAVCWAQAPAWPTRPLKLIIPYAAGGGTDNAGRMLATQLSSTLGQPVVVENRPGAGSAIGAEALAKAPPDGYTLMVATSATLTVNPQLMSKLPYQVSDLAPVAIFSRLPLYVVVSATEGPRSFAELVSKGKSRELTFGTAGNGTMGHLGAELIGLRSGVKLVHIPFKGLSAALPEVATGRVDFAVADTSSARGLIDAGKIKMLATSLAQRSALEPEVPSMTEVGLKDVDVSAWLGIAAPKGTNPLILRRIESEIMKAMANPEVRQQFARAGVEPYAVGTNAFNQLLKSEASTWKQVIDKTGVKLD